jgi:hypothetical protein
MSLYKNRKKCVKIEKGLSTGSKTTHTGMLHYRLNDADDLPPSAGAVLTTSDRTRQQS